MNTKRIISILTTLCLIVSCFTGVISVSAEDAVLESISAETVCAAILSTDSTINVTATQEEGYVGVAITSELLKEHENGEGTPGYWAGFAVVAPEGATHLKYAFGTSDEIELGEAYALTDGDAVTADGKKGIAFYSDAGSDDAKKYAKLQWFSDETTAISAETAFVMNLDGIVRDGIDNLYTISTDDICAAILSADADSEISATATQEEGYISVAITSELLKEHENGEGTPGYWAGFAVVAPEGATHLKYAFGTSDEIELGAVTPITEIVTAEGTDGIAFYANAGSHDSKKYAKLQWFSDETTAMSAEATFVMNLDGINLDGIAKEYVEIVYLDKKSGYVDLYGIQPDDDVSVDFSKIKMEYAEDEPEDEPVEYVTEFDVANVADYDSDDAVYDEGSYKVELINEYEICITMKNLVMHTNGNGDEGHWTGFSVKAPEGAKYLTYWKTFGNNSYDYQTITFEEGQIEESFYINVTECDIIEEIELQWSDENHSPLSDYEYYEIDLSNVEIAAENEVAFETANVCDSFPGENAPAKVYEDYSVELNGNIIKIAMTDLVLHRNANKEPGYWTGFTVNVPEGTKYLTYDKNFGHEWYIPHTITLEDGQTSESFYFDVMDGYYYGFERTITLQFCDENNRPITRRMTYEIDNSDVEITYPDEYTISKANVADFDSDEPVYEEYDVACEWNTIELSATNLKAHTNGNGDEGHWIGFSVEAPEGATHYTYDFGNSYEDTPVALEEGETAVSFYVNASAPYAKDWLEIRWYCDETDPESYPYAYYYSFYRIDITNVDLADDVAVTVTAANIVNQNAPETAPYTGTPSATVEDGTIKLEVEDLKTHFNGAGEIGAWVGASISRPAGAEYVKYVFENEYYAWWGEAEYVSADEVADADSISFYADAYDVYPKDTIMIQWFDENEVAITNLLTYTLDLSDVDYLVEDEAELSIEKANIVDQADPEVDPFFGEYDAVLDEDTIKLSADFIKEHENGEGNYGAWIGFKASVEGAKYLKYVFENDDWYNDWAWDEISRVVEILGSESFYVNASDYNGKNMVMLQWFDENGNALTNVNTYKIDIEKVTIEDWFPVLFSNIELTGSDARFYELEDDEFENWVSTEDYVYVLTSAGANGSVALTVNGEDESNGGNVFYRDENKTVTLTATPNSGYVFNGWYDIRTGNNVSNTASYKIALDACYELEAKFKTSSSGRPSSSGGGIGISIAKPVANVPAGEVEAGTKVELSTKTEDAVIYYTVDGTTPSAESILYSGAITINEDTTIKAIAIKGKTKSSVLTVKYTVKKVAEGEKPGVTAPVFTDITNYAWANEAIVALAEKGIIKGVSDTEFAPANDIKRADFMLLLVRMLDLKADVTSNFDDISADKYYYEGVGIAKALGLTTGVGDNKFNPEASITRQDMFVLAYRILQMQNAGLVDADESAINTFDDYSKIADYAKEGLSSLVKNNLVKGSDNKINPVGNATRAETAVFIYRLYNLLNK